MRHTLSILLIPWCLLLSGCCAWWDCPDELEESVYDHVRVENHTDQPVSIRWSTGTGISDLRETVSSGGYKNIYLRRHSSIKADYNHIIHYFEVEAGSGPKPKQRTLILEADDFVPATPVANG
jgi:hypothetical protein